MLNPLTLSFVSDRTEQEYRQKFILENQPQFLLFTIMIEVILISDLIYYTNEGTLYVSLSLVSYMIIQLVSCFIYYKKPQQHNKVLFFIKVIVFLTVDVIEQYQINLSDDENFHYVLGNKSMFIQMLIFFQGTSFLKQSISSLIVFVLRFILFKHSPINYAELTIIYVSLLFFRYKWEKLQRLDYIDRERFRQTNTLLEDVLPTWLLILGLDRQDDYLEMKGCNKYLRKRFGFHSDTDMRATIRKLEVFKVPNNESNYQIPSLKNYKINFERMLINLLKDDAVSMSNFNIEDKKQPENERYIAILQETDQKITLKVRVMYYYSHEPQVMLLFEDITDLKYEKLQNDILRRDRYYSQVLERVLQEFGKSIGLLNYLKENTNYKKSKQVKQHIQENYFAYCLGLNASLMLQLQMKTFKFNLSIIHLNDLLEKLKKDLNLDVIYQDTFNRNSCLNSDYQKLAQIIVTVVDFIHQAIKSRYSQEQAKRVLTTRIKLKATYSLKYKSICFRFFHPNLDIPYDMSQILCRNNTQSTLNCKRWGLNDHFTCVIKLQEKMDKIAKDNGLADQQSPSKSETTPHLQNKNIKFFCSPMPMAQFLVSQIGPHNQFYFKCLNENANSFKSVQIEMRKQTDIKTSFLKPVLSDKMIIPPPRRSQNSKSNRPKVSFSEQGFNQIKFYAFRDMNEIVCSIIPQSQLIVPQSQLIYQDPSIEQNQKDQSIEQNPKDLTFIEQSQSKLVLFREPFNQFDS